MRRNVASLVVLAAALASLVAAMPATALPAAGCAPGPAMTFRAPAFVDTNRAGGEPMIQTHPNGTLLYAAHAGTTHFFTPAAGDDTTSAFVDNYEGQTYFWYSTDNGEHWTFVPRVVPNNVPLSGFSDPDFAVDAAGNVYLSEINLINVAMSKSSDIGKSWQLQNFFAQDMTDRQWSEADQENVVYLVGNPLGGGTSTDPVGHIEHTLYKSKDGGVTFSPGVDDAGGLGDLRVDKSDGTLYEMHYSSSENTLEIAAFRRARADDLTPSMHTIATGVDMRSHWPAFDIDREGNLYAVWDETGEGDSKRASGVWYAYSTDRGAHWSKPLRVDVGPATDIWPWIAVGDPGRVAIAWFQAEKALPDDDAETQGDHAWNLMAAQTVNGLGCMGSARPGFSVATATRAIHRGTVCMGGTTCQAQAIDRRLGDYFAIEVDATGRMVAAYSDTSQGGAVSLPGFVRQSGGASFFGPTTRFSMPSKPSTNVLGTRRGTLATTGVNTAASVALGLAAVSAAASLSRRLRGRRR